MASPHKSPTYSEIVVKALLEAGDNGASKEELSKLLGNKESNVFGVIHHTRKKGFKIKTVGNRYFLKSVPEPTPEAKQTRKYTKKSDAGMKAPESNLFSHIVVPALSLDTLKKELLTMCPSDQRDCMEMYQKALFYHMSTDAFIKAHKIKLELTK